MKTKPLSKIDAEAVKLNNEELKKVTGGNLSSIQDPTFIIGRDCFNCGLCVDKCFMNALHCGEHRAYIDIELCIFCRECVDVCPTGAIRIEE